MLHDTPYGKFWAEAQAEVDAFILSEAKRHKIKELHGYINSRLISIAAKYPERERETWPEQHAEALRVKSGDASSCPLLTVAATEAGVTIEQLADVIIANADAWAVEAGQVVGKRIRLEREINEAQTPDDLEEIEFEQID